MIRGVEGPAAGGVIESICLLCSWAAGCSSEAASFLLRSGVDRGPVYGFPLLSLQTPVGHTFACSVQPSILFVTDLFDYC
jgi:hypothetical protein